MDGITHISVDAQRVDTYWEGHPHSFSSPLILPRTNTSIISISYGNGKNISTIREVSIHNLQTTQRQITQ